MSLPSTSCKLGSCNSPGFFVLTKLELNTTDVMSLTPKRLVSYLFNWTETSDRNSVDNSRELDRSTKQNGIVLLQFRSQVLINTVIEAI